MTSVPLDRPAAKKAGPEYPKAAACLVKDKDELLTFYDFPAEHWLHLRTTNPIESTFATVRLRHRRTKGNGSRRACLGMVFKLAQIAEKGWRRLNGSKLLLRVIAGCSVASVVLAHSIKYCASEKTEAGRLRAKCFIFQ